jgi:hypothetical protein
MTSPRPRLPVRLALRVAISATLAVSGVIHADLYVHSYRHIPTIGPGFLVQASISCALAMLILIGAPDWFSWVAAALSTAAVIAFALSRTVGLFGFTERGWQPSPQAALAVMAEALTVLLVAAALIANRRRCFDMWG